MTQHVFSVYDAKAEAYLMPFTANTYGIAERMFSDLVNQQGHQFNRHPQDYTLYRIGIFEGETGLIEHREHSPIAGGLSVLAQWDRDERNLSLAGV